MAHAFRDMGVTGEDVLATMQDLDDPVTTAAELADHLPASPSTILSRLNALEAGGYVRSKKVGGRARVWWLVDDPSEGEETDSDER